MCLNLQQLQLLIPQLQLLIPQLSLLRPQGRHLVFVAALLRLLNLRL